MDRALLIGVQAAKATPDVPCRDGNLPLQPRTDDPPDLVVTGRCTVGSGTTYYYRNVNILDGGTLLFIDNPLGPRVTEFWASSIIIESGGATNDSTCPPPSR